MMFRIIRFFLPIFFLISIVDTIAEDHLSRQHEMWPIIESLVSDEHKRKISEKDSSAYLMPESGPLENSVLFGYQDLVVRFSEDDDLLEKEGVLSLYLAASLGRADAIKTLLCKGVDINAPFKNGLTPLYAAAEFGEIDTFKLLLDRGADINHRANTPFTILQLALAERRILIVEYLLDSEYVITVADKGALNKLWPVKR